MKERLMEFLKAENKSSAQLAEEIGVQPSGISHILSGRNNPSLDFVLKMVEKYKFLSTDWLLFGKGSMYKVAKDQTLFDEKQDDSSKYERSRLDNGADNLYLEDQNIKKGQKNMETAIPLKSRASTVVKIVWFYDDNSFEEYFPKL